MNPETYLHLYQDSGNDYDLNDGTNFVVDEGAWVPAFYNDGDAEVVEEIGLIVKAATLVGVLEAITDLNQLLGLAEYRKEHDRSLNRFWISHRPDSTASIRKAEVYKGKCAITGVIGRGELVAPELRSTGYVAYTTLTVHHDVPRSTSATTLTFGPGTPASSKALVNHDDSTANHDNYVTITPTTLLEGDPPPLVELDLVQTVGELIEGYIGVATPPSVGAYALNAEDNANIYVGNLQDDITAPGVTGAAGIGRRYESTTTLSGQKLVDWLLDEADMLRLNGRYKVMMRCRASGSTDTMQAKVGLNYASVTATYGEYVTIAANGDGWNVYDMGVLDIPPEFADPAALDSSGALLVVAGHSNGGTTDKIYIADIILLPVHVSLTYIEETTYTLIDASTERWQVLTDGHEHKGVFRQIGTPWYTTNRIHGGGGSLPLIVPRPPVTPVLVFLLKNQEVGGGTDNYDITSSLTVSGTSTPRWRTL